MKAFARLLVDLLHAPSTRAKTALMKAYFAVTPDPARGIALEGLTGGLDIKAAKASLFRELAAARVDPVLFDLSYDFVGDLAETVALIWPAPAVPADPPALPDLVAALRGATKAEMPGVVGGLLDRLDTDARWALLKLVLGGTRVGVSERLAKTALAEYGGKDVAEIEEIWPGLAPPYLDLFAWLEGHAPRPTVDTAATFRPMMLAQPLDPAELDTMDPADWRAEWKWDGVRVQLAASGGKARLWTRTGEDIGQAFPELTGDVPFEAVLDGELLVRSEGETGTFAELQQRLNRKKPDAALRRRLPAFVRVYDMLAAGPEDLRTLPFDERRRRLETWHGANPDVRFELSGLVAFEDWAALGTLRGRANERAVEGLMLKRGAGTYLAGRPKGEWFKWKRDPRTADAVLVYAQRGHGKRSSYFSDFTFACWLDDRLVPVGKAYSGFSDAEMKRLDKFVRENTLDRHGPVAVVAPKLVVELEFDGVQRSTRHKSGIALRFPRVARVRWDKPAEEADRVETLAAMAAE
ncbi:MAG: cisplatin damage response ATP-dependent DNA ligase [Alphaproteobacteria bacterium]|nr:cisplatin damage response ATP-dependent DNA ligase [Alphaproteobacteria bacterium]